MTPTFAVVAVERGRAGHSLLNQYALQRTDRIFPLGNSLSALLQFMPQECGGRFLQRHGNQDQ